MTYLENNEALNAVKMRGLPFRITFEEIFEFFKNYSPLEKSVQIQIGSDGRKNGWGAILFSDENSAQAAATDLNRQYIGSRFVELYVISYQDYVHFGGGGKKIDSGQTRSDDQSLNMINSDNQDRSLLMRGLPFKVEMSDI